jgi:putative ABC transport system permease protein
VLSGRFGAFAAVAVGTAMVTATLSLLSSASPQIPDRFAAVAVAVQSPAAETPANPFAQTRPWSSEQAGALAAQLAGVAGVTAAIPDRTFYAQPVIDGRPSGTVQEGHGWASSSLAPHPLIAGRPPVSETEVVAGRSFGIPVGGSLTVLTATGPSERTVTGLVIADALYVSDAVAARLSPGVRVIGLLGDPDPAALPPVGTVLTGAGLGALEPRADARSRWIGMQVVTAMTALAAFSSIFVIASTFAFSVNQRRRELGLLRAIGATPKQIRRSVLREAAAVGALAAVGGTLLGVLATPVLGRVLVDAGFQPPSYVAGPHLWPIAVGVASGPVAALLGALAAAHRAARVGPLEALRRAEVETRPMTRPRWVAGLAFTAIGATAGVLTALTDDVTDLATYALIGAMAVIVAATLLGPVVVPPLVRVLLWPMRGPIGLLARESALTAVRRTASTAAPVLLTVAFAVSIAGQVQTSTAAFADQRGARIQAGSVLTPDGTPGLTDDAVASTGGSALMPTTVYLPDPAAVPEAGATPASGGSATATPGHGATAASAVGVDPAALGSALPGTAGAAGALTAPDTVILTHSRAAQSGRAIGDRISVIFADGTAASLRVVATVPTNAVPAEMLLGRATVRAHDPSALASAVLVPGPPPAHPEIGARVVDVATFAREADAEEDRLVWVFTVLLIAISAGYGAMAVANTLIMATAQRAGDFHRLRLAGATRRQILLVVATESTVVVAIGTILGAACAVLALWGSAAGLGEQTGQPVSPVIPWPTLLAVTATCLALALIAGVLPVRLSSARQRRRSAPDF